jgi:DNA-binding NarL/FixJ family response regulator
MPADQSGKSRKIKVLLAFGNIVLSEALKELMNKYKCDYSVETLYPLNGSSSESWSNCDVIVTNYLSLQDIPQECFESSKVIVMELGLKKETLASLFLTEKISGVIKGDSDIGILLKAIRAVHNGEFWIDNYTVGTLLSTSMSRRTKDSAKLTEREFALVKMVKEGYRNKEIAKILCISEQTVKSHLSRIFRKMNVSGRTELLKKVSDQTNI